MRPLIASFLLIFLLASCAAPTESATQTVEVTVTFNVTVTSTVSPTPATEPVTPTATPESLPAETLLPPDFTVENWQEFRTAILPYCYVNPEYSDSRAGVEKFYGDVQKLDFWKEWVEKFKNDQTYGYGPSVVPVPGGGGCGAVMVMRGSDMKITSAFFQSKLDPSEWIEVVLTEPTTLGGK